MLATHGVVMHERPDIIALETKSSVDARNLYALTEEFLLLDHNSYIYVTGDRPSKMHSFPVSKLKEFIKSRQIKAKRYVIKTSP